jgi:hypothetical protein
VGNVQGFFYRPVTPNRRAPISGLLVRFIGNQLNLNLNLNAPLVRFVTGLPGGLERLPLGLNGLPLQTI